MNNQQTYSEFNDTQLLKLIANRDRIALEELYNRYKIPVGRFLELKLGQTKLIEECYNDVMLVIWQKANTFRGDSKVSTWIFSIAYRTQLSLSRKEQRHKSVQSEELMDDFASKKNTTFEIETKINEVLYEALTELSNDHRTVIELCYFHGYSMDEISNIVGCPQNTVKTRLFHARKKLKESINLQNNDNDVIATKTEEKTTKSNSLYFNQNINISDSDLLH